MSGVSGTPATAIRANCCDAWWTGLKPGHCTSCHHTFSSVTAFDKHRTGPMDNRTCLTPESVGLVPMDRVWAGWGFPGSYDREEGNE